MWCIAELNEEYIARMEGVLAIYEKPLSDKAPVVCVDEKPVVLHADVRPPRPMRPGRIARRDSEHQRRGTANAFCGVEPKAGRHFTKVTPNRSAPLFADYLLEIIAAYPGADTIHLVLDNRKRHFLAALFWGCSGFKLDLWWPYGRGGLGWKLEPRLGKAVRDAGGTGLRRRSGGSWNAPWLGSTGHAACPKTTNCFTPQPKP
jgi:hypothetical protein